MNSNSSPKRRYTAGRPASITSFRLSSRRPAGLIAARVRSIRCGSDTGAQGTVTLVLVMWPTRRNVLLAVDRVGVLALTRALPHVGAADRAEGVLGPVVDVARQRRVGWPSRRGVGVAVVDRIALYADLDAVDALLDRGVFGLVPLTQEHRDGDGGQDADDDDDDEELDEGEAAADLWRGVGVFVVLTPSFGGRRGLT